MASAVCSIYAQTRAGSQQWSTVNCAGFGRRPRGSVPSHSGDWLARGKQARQVDLDGIHAANVMHYYPDLSSVLGERVCHSTSDSVFANAAGADAPASRRVARASDLLIFASSIGSMASMGHHARGSSGLTSISFPGRMATPPPSAI